VKQAPGLRSASTVIGQYRTKRSVMDAALANNNYSTELKFDKSRL
jgi:hypothetical protein